MASFSRHAWWLAAVLPLAMVLPATADKLVETDSSSSAAVEEKDDRSAMEKEIDRLKDEARLLSAEYDLLTKRQKNELAQLELERQRLQAEASLREARRAEQLGAMKAELERLQTEASLREARQNDELAKLQAEVERMNAERSHADATRSLEMMELSTESRRLNQQNAILQAKLDTRNIRGQLAAAMAKAEADELRMAVQLRDAKDSSADIVLNDLDYAKRPFDNGVLHISDRRIALNGPIISGTADWITQRIHYFNNQSDELPIFIVIDNSPGGSVMEGYRIVKAIEESDAPIHVVVKSFAASMAATIATLADHSYAYPNAVILHHQMSSGMRGNLTQQEEQLENAKEWARRLAQPIARKMGISYERFVELMYENNSNGDWEEFADRAVELKWVNDVVREIRETGIRRRPTGEAPRPFFFFLFGQAPQDGVQPDSELLQRDSEGRPFIQLPPLRPFDHYFLYDPQDFFRY